MSAAETGSGPDIPRRRLRVATPAAGQDDGDPAASPPGAGAEPGPAAPDPDYGRPRLAAPELRATELRVREVRVVREASLRTLRASGSGPAVAQARMASQARAAQAPAVTRAHAAAQVWAAGSTPSPGSTRSATAQTRVVTHRRAAVQVRATRTVSQRPGAVRLTRRGRLVVAGFATLVVIVAVTLLWMTVAGSVQASSRGGSAPRSPYQGMHRVVVQPGQTLWSIAVAAEPSANTWAVIQRITEVNALNGPEVSAGQQLWVPNG